MVSYWISYYSFHATKYKQICVFADLQDVVTSRNDNMLVSFMKSSTLNRHIIAYNKGKTRPPPLLVIIYHWFLIKSCMMFQSISVSALCSLSILYLIHPETFLK